MIYKEVKSSPLSFPETGPPFPPSQQFYLGDVIYRKQRKGKERKGKERKGKESKQTRTLISVIDHIVIKV